MDTGKFLRSLALGAAVLAAPVLARADVVMDWNDVALKAIVTTRLVAPPAVRAMAAMHTAMFDAMDAVDPRYRPYRFTGSAPAGASPEAAAAAAAHTVLSQQFPDQRAEFDKVLAQSLAAVPEGAARDGGAALGRTVAEALLAWCADDGVGKPTAYRPVTQPGVYVPTTLPAFDDFGASRPWLLQKADQFRPAPPPALTSEVWKRDLEEIRTVGARTGSTRTPEQTQVGQFWAVTGPAAYNALIRQSVAQRKLDPLSEARVMALTYMAFNDAYVAVFDAKYAYQFWRPITAVRNGDLHKDFVIKREAGWLPLVDTPMHPEYPCAHCISAAAVIGVLQATLGQDPGPLTMTSSTLPGVTRKWDHLSDVEKEVSNARIWSGVHYRNSTEVGTRMGREVAAYAVKNYLQPK